ncbi:MAG: glycosyl hydrolase [Novosphingobium sp.]
MLARKLALTIALAGASVASMALAEAPGGDRSLEDQFRDPPQSARPRVWWHWMNGNISKDGIAKDLAWMKRVGIGGMQNFDANMKTPRIVDKRLVYMTPEWKDAFRFAASEADRLGLELAIAASPGWSETGGPWVQPQDGLKKLVWSETAVVGGKRFVGRLAAPPSVTGPYKTIAKKVSMGSLGAGTPERQVPVHYSDVAVLAYPFSAPPAMVPTIRDGNGHMIDAAALSDDDLGSEFEVAAGGSAEAPRTIVFVYAQPQTVRSARLFAPKAVLPFIGPLFEPRLEASVDGAGWHPIAEMPLGDIPATVAFAPVTARRFRVVLAPRVNVRDILAQYGVSLSQIGLADPASLFAEPLGIADFRLSSADRIDRAEAKAGFALVPDYFALSQGVPDAPGISPTQVIDLTARLRANGTLDWTPPAGRWKVLRLGYSLLGTVNHPAPPEATGLEVDKFDGPAVRRYIEHYLGMYRDASGGLIGARGVRALLTDSTEIGAANWTPRMIAQFRRLRGYDPTPWLPALTGTIIGSRRQSDAFLYDYRRTLADLMASEHYGTVAAVAHENGLKVYGEALEDQRPVIGDDMAMRRYTDVPMAAMWTYARDKGPRVTLLADIKGAASVAHIYGQNLVAAESLTATGPPWGWAPSDLKRIIDLEFALGVNRPVIHTSVHAPVDDKLPGLSLGGIGQYFNRQESWAEMAKPWIDYMARNSLMLQQGRNVADIAYFYGEEAPITGLYGEHPIADAPRRYAYDFVNADVLAGALTNDGPDLVATGGARYRALYLGGQSRQMTLPMLRRLAALVEAGATVIGPRPEGDPGLGGNAAEWSSLVAKLWAGGEQAVVGKGRVIASTDVEGALGAIGLTPDFHFTGGQADSEILFVHRKLSDGDSYFLSNRKDRAEMIEARFRIAGKAAELWHADTGESEPVSYRIENGETLVPLALAPEESVHVVFRKPAAAGGLTVGRPAAPTELARLEGPWTVAFQPGRGAPASASFASLTPLDERPEAGIKYFSGVATYSKTFAVPRAWRTGQPLWLDLGEAREVAEVRVNGMLAGTAWHAPYRVDIGKVAKPGSNRLEVRVANLWVNRLIGDAQPGAVAVTWTGLQPYKPDAPLRRSGLIGPVTLGASR